MAGDDLQSLIFWQQACRLFTEPDKVECVAYSDRKLGVFDDVVTYYHPGSAAGNQSVRADCYQVKFNMRSAHPITAGDLMDPSAVGRAKRALLDDLVALWERSRREDVIYRPILRSTWYPAHGDALGDLWLRTDGRLALEELITAGGRTRLGKALRDWVDYLGKWEAQELEPMLRHFRITPISDLESQLRGLNTRLANAGLQVVDQTHRSSPYDDLIRKLVQNGHHRFDEESLRQILEQEGLVVGKPVHAAGSLTVGIRTFSRASEHMLNLHRCLDMRHVFEGRHISSQDSWSQDIEPAIEDLIQELLLTESAIDLDLSATHSSVAFLIGRLLDTKSGLRTTVIQRTGQGVVRWEPPAGPPDDDLPSWEVEVTEFGGAADIAVALSATHDVDCDVRCYMSDACLDIGRALSFKLSGQIGRTAVQSAEHAYQLADQLVGAVRANRKPGVRQRVHVFGAAPNALMFFLGQASRALGECQLYEYDFEANMLGAYTPSLLIGT